MIEHEIKDAADRGQPQQPDRQRKSEADEAEHELQRQEADDRQNGVPENRPEHGFPPGKCSRVAVRTYVSHGFNTTVKT